MDFDSVREDLLVASVAAAGSVGLTLALVVLANVSVPFWLRASPLVVYFAYLFSRKGGPYASFDTPRNWALFTMFVTVAAAGYAMLA